MAETKPKRKRRRGRLTFFVLVIALIVIIATVSSSKKNTPSKPAGPFVATDAQMAAAVTDAVDSDSDSANVNGTPSAQCVQESAGNSMSGHAGINCFVTYTVKEPAGISAALELIDPTRGFFKTAFTDPSVQAVMAQVKGPTTSVGGKTSVSDLFSLACTRQAANQIDWDNVGVSGLKQLCTYSAQVGGLNS